VDLHHALSSSGGEINFRLSEGACTGGGLHTER
jgi:hypothetical protein